jgi:hypothetical protein
MTLNDALHNGQANARAFEFGDAVQPLKNAKKLARVLRV